MNPATESAIEFLFSRINYERSLNMPYQRADLKLDRMMRLLELAGHPERGQRIIHIAGTKGKGSTSHLLASILTSAGCRTGRFTSPHLHRIEERFASMARTVRRPSLPVTSISSDRSLSRWTTRQHRMD